METLFRLITEAGGVDRYLGWLIAVYLIVQIIMMRKESIAAQDRNTETILKIVRERQERDREIAEMNRTLARMATTLDERLPRQKR